MRTRLLTVVLLVGAAAARAQEITVAAASDLQFAFQEVTARFEKETGTRIKLVFGSSGNFFTQIQNGAPFDLFFSADMEYPRKLEAAGLTVPGSLYQYATGKLVLFVPRESHLDLSRGLKVLSDAAVKKIAIANPAHAPYGRAAVAALQKEGVYDAVSGKLVLGENISQAASFVASGNADAALLARSLAVAPSMQEKGRYVDVPADDYAPIDQACVILSSSHQKEAAQKFLGFLKRSENIQLMRQYGFAVPGP